MHIKQITISGFKSYLDATIVGPFSPAHNVVVGRNGSGKSNFFDAVRFVLSDSATTLRAEDRVKLLHEGAGASVLSAYVEMVFDNTDGRLPSDRDEVALRRMIGLKKDEYVLDRKNVTRTEVFNLLEAAGFSRSNPYYIVQQGKVAKLCAMSDVGRLELLQEVAGTSVYDERREESLKIMEDTDRKREKITEVIQYIETRLAELESEKEELRAFQKLDRDRKALQYTIHVRELEEAKAALDALDDDRAHHRSRADELQARLVEFRTRIASADREAGELGEDIKRSLEERDGMDGKRKEARDAVAKLQVDVSEAEQVAKAAKETVASTRSELVQVREVIAQKRTELQPLETQFKQLKRDEAGLRKRIADGERKVLSLRVKADRTNQFSSVEARDAHLRKTIRETRKRRDDATKQIARAQKDIDKLERAIANNQGKKDAAQRECQELTALNTGPNVDLTALHKERTTLVGHRQDAWRQIAEMENKMKGLEGNMGKLEAAKRSVIGGNAYYAIGAVMKAAMEDPRNLGPNRVFGPVLDLIEVDSKFATAADVIAGSALTHVVVDSDATAARLVNILQSRRAGRVTFIPLNRLDDDHRPPPAGSNDAIPLVSKISCDQRFHKVVKQIFNRTLVTRTVTVATEMSRQHGVDCVTLEGDQVNKRGAMTGGFIDISRSRIGAARYLRDAKKELVALQPDFASLKDKAARIEAQLSRVTGEIQSREARQRSANSKIARLNGEMSTLDRYMTADKNNIPRANERISAAEETVATAERTIADLETELESPMVSGLSPQEEALVAQLKAELEELRPNLGSKVQQRSRVEKLVVALKSELTGNLERRAAELETTMNSTADTGVMSDRDGVETRAETILKKKREELEVAAAELEAVKVSMEKTDAVLHRKQKKFARLSAQMDHDREEEAKVNKALEDDRDLVERQYNQKSVEQHKKADAEKSIRELGSLPADFDKYRDLSMGVLMKKLKKVNHGLQKYSHVNKKALDQFLSFTEQRESLTRRREELDSGAEAIRNLIESLDQRKDEDILRTYRGVTKFFCEVFSELVPGGKASLIMKKSSGDADMQDGEEAEASRIKYTGVGMKVSFSTTGKAYKIQQLSGGQKSIVALSLIFAIQRLDPAPFYLFDEIDANLDATHRQAVANLIRKQSLSGTQFVTTTFRPEFVHAGDMWYGVTHKRKVSSIEEVGKEVALTFVTNEPSAT